MTRATHPEVRFWRYVDKDGPNGCWLWTGALSSAGYGAFGAERMNGRNRNAHAHRFAYELLVGPVPAGLHIDHLCRVPACCNPDHLEPVTPRENTLRGIGPSAQNAVATHCKYGHEFTPENTYRPNGNGPRVCRECKRRIWREWMRRKTEQCSVAGCVRVVRSLGLCNAHYIAHRKQQRMASMNSLLSAHRAEAEFVRTEYVA